MAGKLHILILVSRETGGRARIAPSGSDSEETSESSKWREPETDTSVGSMGCNAVAAMASGISRQDYETAVELCCVAYRRGLYTLMSVSPGTPRLNQSMKCSRPHDKGQTRKNRHAIIYR